MYVTANYATGTDILPNKYAQKNIFCAFLEVNVNF